MIWVAWRQFRTQAFVTIGLLAAFAVLVLVTGLHLRDIYSSSGTTLTGSKKLLSDLLPPALLAIPALLGMFWGAPLVARELEGGTYRLAWTQSVTRRRWLSVKVALVGTVALAVAGLASWLVSWWFSPVDAFNMNRFDPSVFTARGIVAVGYAGFAFALGVATGALMRRTLPAMASTLLGFIAARTAVTVWLRPHLLPASHILFPLTKGKAVGFLASPSGVSVFAGSAPLANGWSLSATLVDRAHHPLSTAQLHDLLVRVCPAIAAGVPPNPGAAKNAAGPASGAFFSCLHALSPHIQLLVTYQPSSHYWPLQVVETMIFLATALALIAVTIWRIGPRRAHTRAVGDPHDRTAAPLAPDVAPEIGATPVQLRRGGQ
jgi:hypothetical protein